MVAVPFAENRSTVRLGTDLYTNIWHVIGTFDVSVKTSALLEELTQRPGKLL